MNSTKCDSLSTQLEKVVARGGIKESTYHEQTPFSTYRASTFVSTGNSNADDGDTCFVADDLGCELFPLPAFDLVPTPALVPPSEAPLLLLLVAFDTSSMLAADFDVTIETAAEEAAEAVVRVVAEAVCGVSVLRLRLRLRLVVGAADAGVVVLVVTTSALDLAEETVAGVDADAAELI